MFSLAGRFACGACGTNYLEVRVDRLPVLAGQLSTGKVGWNDIFKLFRDFEDKYIFFFELLIFESSSSIKWPLQQLKHQTCSMSRAWWLSSLEEDQVCIS
jgi:hypothetical protein